MQLRSLCSHIRMSDKMCMNADGAWKGNQCQWQTSFQIMRDIVVQLQSFKSFSLSSEPRDNTSLKVVEENLLLVI